MRLVALCAAALLLAGCSSTREKAAAIADQGSEAFAADGLQVTRANADVEVLDTEVVSDPNGTAAVVTLRNRGAALTDVQLALDVRDAEGASIWKNDAAGLDASLVSVPVLERGERTLWVNDQVLPATGRAARVVARAGAGERAPASLPRLTLRAPKLEEDPVDGVAARGEVVNASRVDQRELVIYGIARKGGEVVAAGRAVVPRVAAGGKAPYAIFFIGDPRGARLEVAAPPTTLEGS